MAGTEFDINKVSVGFAKEMAKDILASVTDFGSWTFKRAEAALGKCFIGYLKASYRKHSKVKTLLYHERPVPLRDFYVATDIVQGDNRFSADNLAPLLDDSMRQVFTGTAGCGKSTMMKHLFIEFIENMRVGIPVFIELRHMNSSQNPSLRDFIYETLRETNKHLTYDQLEWSLEAGRLILMLDGFDEIDLGLRDQVVQHLLSMSIQFPETRIIVSSRPDPAFDSWQEFCCYEVQPLTQGQAIALVEKIDYDHHTKAQFLKELQHGLFERHQGFASIPLLLTMMLMTYEEFAEIPSKIHIFYNQAFDTLFNRHDASKEMYTRKSHTGMPRDDFKEVLSAFSIRSYSKEQVSFTEDEVMAFLDYAGELTGLDFENSKFFADLRESVCILQRDGLRYTYTHRSFQEYFAARYLARFNDPRRRAVLRRLLPREGHDNVLGLLAEINREALEQDLIIPLLEKFTQTAKSLTGGKYHYARILSLWLIEFDFVDHGMGTILLPPDHWPFSLFRLTHRLYPDIIPSAFPDALSMRVSKDRRKAPASASGRESTKEGAIKIMPIDKKKHEILLSFGLDEYAKGHLRAAESLLEHLTKKYEKRAEDIDALFD